MQLNKYLFIFFIIISSFSYSADRIKKNIKSITNIGILTVKINNECNNKKDVIKYININFAGKDFINSFMYSYNSLDQNCKFIALSNLIQNTKNTEYALSTSQIIYDNSYMYFKNNINNNNISRTQLQYILKTYNLKAYAIFELETSIWAQDLKGTMKVYDKNSSLIWSQKIKTVSTYIIQDPQSPYISEYDKFFDALENKPSHKTEIIKMFNELASNLALDIHKKKAKYLKLNKIEKKKARQLKKQNNKNKKSKQK